MHASNSTPGVTTPEYVKFQYHDSPLRGDLYQFLAGAYLSPPSKEFVDQLVNTQFIDDIRNILGEVVVAPLYDIATSLDSNESLDRLQQEYMDLFVVPTGLYVTPFEDVYRGLRMDGGQERGPLLGDRAATAKLYYRIAGADMDKTCKELPTHIGVELSFMSFLCQQEKQASSDLSDDEEFSEFNINRLWQLKFLHEHLTDWFPQLNLAIQSKAITPFYRSLAQFTEGFLIQDKACLIRQLEFDLQTTSTESESE